MGLKEYRRKRDFSRTPEPAGSARADRSERMYVIQKHAASHLHYDLRLEMGGVLKSWAVPKGPSLDPAEKRLAVHVEDHPVEYGSFEGVIPEGEYGGGTVMLWDVGSWIPEGDPETKYRKGHLTFRLEGKKLQGSWTLARMGGSAGEEGKNWLLIKRKDGEARPLRELDVLEEHPLSVTTGRSMEEIGSSKDRVWSGESGEIPAPHPNGVPDPSGLPGARRSSMPSSPKPQLARLEKSPPTGDQWLHEIKYDGYRILCLKRGNEVRLISRNGKDWTARFPTVTEAAASISPERMILDGEMVVLRPDGRTDFQALQNAMEGAPSGPIGYYVFDVLYSDGFDLTRTPLLERKEYLKRVLENSRVPPFLLFGDHIRGKGEVVYEHACSLGMEGIVSKRAESRYESRRSGSWLKVKCTKRQEFVIGGYTDPSGARSGFGALLVGTYNATGELVFAGRVGTGFNEQSLSHTLAALKPLETGETPFTNPPKGREARGVHWVRPKLVAEVEFTERTEEGILRHPSFKGLREDKEPKEVRLEEPGPESQRSEIRGQRAGRKGGRRKAEGGIEGEERRKAEDRSEVRGQEGDGSERGQGSRPSAAGADRRRCLHHQPGSNPLPGAGDHQDRTGPVLRKDFREDPSTPSRPTPFSRTLPTGASKEVLLPETPYRADSGSVEGDPRPGKRGDADVRRRGESGRPYLPGAVGCARVPPLGKQG